MLEQDARLAARVVVPVIGFQGLVAGTCRCSRQVGAGVFRSSDERTVSFTE